MRVLLTGAGGLVGAHTVAALLAEPDRFAVRALARSPGKLHAALAPLGVRPAQLEVTQGDVTHPASVRAAVAGCDAVVHAAGLYSADVNDEALMQRTNVEGTRCVLEAAVAAGADPVVHVSSYLALFPPCGEMMGADDPVTTPQSAYARTKAEAETIARALQASGAAVVTLYPGAIHGPLDPTFGASPAYLADAIRTRRMLVNRGGRGYIDARDLAALIARTLEPGLGPRRFMCGGRHVADADVLRLLCKLTGQPIRALRIPGPVLRTMGRFGDLYRLLTGRAPALTYEAACVITRSVPCDDSAALALLGLEYIGMEQSLRDLLVWMTRAGHLTPEQAGPRLAAAASLIEESR
jgi:nucleoside-diphosphate-sugar epimerase